MVYILSGRFDFFEKFEDFSRTHEKYQLDEIFTVIIFITLYMLLRLIIQHRRLVEKNTVIAESLSEKSILLRESKHRQKNNINILLGLLELEKEHCSTPETIIVYNKLVSRLESMGIIYTSLDNSESNEYLSSKSYFESFFERLAMVYSNGKIRHELEVEDVAVHPDLISPLSIMINELYTNTVKYAFPEQADCRVFFSLKAADGMIVICFSDNGIGFDADKVCEGFGLKLFHSLAKQLKAETSIIDGRHYISLSPEHYRPNY